VELEISIETLATGGHQVIRVPIGERLTLGRGPDSPILLEGPQISREHLILALAGGQLSLWNLSANGTAVNGAPIATGFWQPLQLGDVVQLPGYNLTFLPLGQAVPAPPSFWATITTTERTVFALLAAAVTVAVVFWKM
jgi:pSer/pThr/pTyr-binding forkhead associated (FHA) protein